MKDNSKRKLKKLIEELVSQETQESLIKEESVFVKAFVEPFTDIAQTAFAGIKKNAATLLGNASKLAKQAAIAALPFVAISEMDRIGKEEEQKLRERLGEIDSEYADVLERNWETLRTRDMAGIGFLLNPQAGLASELVKRAPATGLGILEVLTGGNPKVTELRKKSQKLYQKVLPPGAGTSTGFGGGGGWDFGGDFGDGGFGESVSYKLQEQQPAVNFTKDELDQKIADVVQGLLKKPDVQRAIEENPILQSLQATAIDVIMDRAKKVAKFNKYEDFKNYMGSTEFGKFENKLKETLPPEATPEQLAEVETAMVPELKQTYKKVFAQQLQDLVKNAPNMAKEVKAANTEISKLM